MGSTAPVLFIAFKYMADSEKVLVGSNGNNYGGEQICVAGPIACPMGPTGPWGPTGPRGPKGQSGPRGPRGLPWAHGAPLASRAFNRARQTKFVASIVPLGVFRTLPYGHVVGISLFGLEAPNICKLTYIYIYIYRERERAHGTANIKFSELGLPVGTSVFYNHQSLPTTT